MLETVADRCQGRKSPVSLRGSRSKPRRLAAWPCHGSRGGRRNRQRSRSRLRRRRRPSLPTSHGSVPRAARPTVAVWTAPDTSRFLTGMETDELRTLLYLVALRGLRRGEAARSVLAQRQSRRGNPDDQPDPSRTPRWFGVAAAKPRCQCLHHRLDCGTVAVLAVHRDQQRRAAGVDRANGFVFAHPDGAAFQPELPEASLPGCRSAMAGPDRSSRQGARVAKASNGWSHELPSK
jgi:hypothetical protein